MQTAEQTDLTWHDICDTAELPKNAGVAALLGDLQIAIFSIGEEAQIYAIANYDPFSDTNVLARGIVGSIGEEIVVASPIYKEHFNLATGQCLEDENVSVASYPVRIENNRISIGLTK